MTKTVELGGQRERVDPALLRKGDLVRAVGHDEPEPVRLLLDERLAREQELQVHPVVVHPDAFQVLEVDRDGPVVDREVERVARVARGLGDDDRGRALHSDLDLADDVDAVLGAVDVVEADGDALDVDGELAQLAAGAIADVVLDRRIEGDLVRAQVERGLVGGGAADLALVVFPDGGGFPIRTSAVFHQEQGEWRIVNLHVSIGVPDAKLEELLPQLLG